MTHDLTAQNSGEMSPWIPQLTQDGSFTFYSEAFGEAFHSRLGAKAEAFEKFVNATRLKELAHQSTLCLLDVCYGLGYNTAAALETIWAINPDCHVQVYGLELDVTVPQAAVQAMQASQFDGSPQTHSALGDRWSLQVEECLRAIALHQHYKKPNLEATLLIGDARQTIQQLCKQKFQADAIFFDPFSPRRCPQLWTVEFLQKVSQCLASRGTLATYSRSASVRAALLAAGFYIGTIPLGVDDSKTSHPSHEWSQGTVAAFTQNNLCPLSQMEQEHLHTRAAIPYRDPSLSDSAETILQRHRHEQEQSSSESTSSWRQRWDIH